MKPITLVVVLAGAVLFGSICYAALAANAAPPSKYEYAVVRWDGPDRVYYNLPDRHEQVELRKQGVDIPRNWEPEEYCLAWIANDMASRGWDAVNMHSRRILFKRLKAK